MNMIHASRYKPAKSFIQQTLLKTLLTFLFIRVIVLLSATDPVISLTSPLQLPDYSINSATVTRITYSDADVHDNSTLTKYLLQSSPLFSVDLDSGKFDHQDMYK